MCRGAPVIAAAPITSSAIRSRPRLDPAGAAHVCVDRQFARGGNAEHVDDFEPRRARSILDSHAYAERSRVDLLP